MKDDEFKNLTLEDITFKNGSRIFLEDSDFPHVGCIEPMVVLGSVPGNEVWLINEDGLHIIEGLGSSDNPISILERTKRFWTRLFDAVMQRLFNRIKI